MPLFFPLLRRAPLLVLFLVAFLSTRSFAASEEFTVIVLPDTQFYSKSYPEIFLSQTQWIVANREALNIRFVVGLGDIVNGGGELSEWENADAAIKVLDGQVPYLLAIGNHDYDKNDPHNRTAATKNFNSYFGPSRYSGHEWYRGHHPSGSHENFYGVFQIDGKEYLVLMLEFTPRASSLEWASSVLNSHPDAYAIVVTHSYMHVGSQRVGPCSSYNADVYGLNADHDGEEAWGEFVRKHSNIALVMSGHIPGVGRRADLGSEQNLVNQMLSNYQHEELGGAGYLRILRFKPAENKIEVKTFSPYLHAYRTDAANQFTIDHLQHSGTGSTVGGVQGLVRSIQDCGPIQNATISYELDSATSDAGGKYGMTGVPGQRSYEFTSKASGWLTSQKSTTIDEGLTASLNFFLSTAGRIEGEVTDGAGQPVSGASVRLQSSMNWIGGTLTTDKTVTTGLTGAYSSNWIPVGDYTATASKSGLDDAAGQAVVKTGLTTISNLIMGGAGTLCPLDSADPSVTICEPTEGSAVASPVRVLAGTTSSSSPTTHMKIYVDHKEVYATNAPQLDTSIAMPAGGHHMVVQAWNAEGNVFKSSVRLTLEEQEGETGPPPASCEPDAAQPSIQICTPADGAALSSPVRVSAAANAASGIYVLQVYVDGKKLYEKLSDRLDTELALATGTRRLAVQARDNQGNWFKKRISISVQ